MPFALPQKVDKTATGFKVGSAMEARSLLLAGGGHYQLLLIHDLSVLCRCRF